MTNLIKMCFSKREGPLSVVIYKKTKNKLHIFYYMKSLLTWFSLSLDASNKFEWNYVTQGSKSSLCCSANWNLEEPGTPAGLWHSH